MSLHGGNQSANASPHPLGVVLALVIGAAQRARVREALRGRYDVRFVDKSVELTQLALSAPEALGGIIVEARDADGWSTIETIRQIRRFAIPAPLIAYCRIGAERSGDLQALVVAGVHELLYEGVDDAGVALQAVLESAQRARVGEHAAAAMHARLPGQLRAFVRQATAHPDTQRVSALADALGYNRKTLVNHCTDAGCPPPQELLAWCRLVVVGEMLTSTTHTIDAIAMRLDFPSDTALRNMIKRYTGLRASEVRARGGMQCILEAFDAEVRGRRGMAEAAS